MKLLEDLGSVWLKPTHKKKSTCGLYECPDCLGRTIARKADVRAGRVLRCHDCSVATKRRKFDLTSFNMELVGSVVYKRPSDGNGKTTKLLPYATLKCSCGDIHEYQCNIQSAMTRTTCNKCTIGDMIIDGNKKCCGCLEMLPVENFGVLSSSASGLQYRCVDCESIKQQKYRDSKDKRLLTARGTASNLGIPLEEVLKHKETTTCGICAKVFESTKEKHLDHDHRTGRVRGVLCRSCNMGLGLFKDDPTSLANAIQWITNE